MGLIIASILTIFLSKREESKILAILFIAYLSLINSLNYLKSVSFLDYIQIYNTSTLILCTCLFIYTKREWKQFSLLLLTVLPHIYYLMVLYKPYMFSGYIPIWWWVNVDTVFMYSVFFLCYEQSTDFSFKFSEVNFREWLLHIAITLFLILF